MPSTKIHTLSEIHRILATVQEIIGYEFQEPENLRYLWLALQSSAHTSAWQRHQFLPEGLKHPEKGKSLNQALAVVGDKEHHFLLLTSVYRNNRSADDLCNIFKHFGSNEFFQEVGRRSGLEPYIQVSHKKLDEIRKKPQPKDEEPTIREKKGTKRYRANGKRQPDSKCDPHKDTRFKYIADAVEGIMGALFFDGGRDAIVQMMVKLDMFEGMPLGCQITSSLEYRQNQKELGEDDCGVVQDHGDKK